MVAKLTNILLDKQNLKCLSNNVCSFGQGFRSITFTMNYLRMDGKRDHVTCGNRLAIERQESFQKFASLEEELLLLLWPVRTLQDFAWLDMRENDSSSIK